MPGNHRTFLVVFLVFLSAVASAQTTLPKAVGPVPDENQMAWHQMEMNAFIHFSINTFTDKEWGYGDEAPELFNPSELDTEQWVRVLKETGFKGVILTVKHHDGFSLWPTKYSDHSIANSPYKNGNGDIVKELSEACKKYGLKFGIYLSPWDRNHPDYGKPEYISYYRNQLEELFTNYGDVFEMWFDGANGGDGYYGGTNETRTIDKQTYYHWPATLDHVRNMQSDVLFFSDAGPGIRWSGNENGIGGRTNWNTITPDTLYAGKAGIGKLLNTGSPEGTEWIPAEVNTSIRPGWFYHENEDSLVKTPKELLDIYLTSVGRGSTLLLNIPPDQRGIFHENDVKNLRKWRDLLDQEFGKNLALHAEVTAGSHRGNVNTFSPGNVTDGNPETYWTTDNGITTGTLEIDVGKSQSIKYILIQEYIQLGQRVKEFNVEIWNGSEWRTVAEETTIGYKRILKIDPVQADKMRVNITDSKATPVISNVEIY
ncbi:MAG: alpha-L-fucosidase [Balneolaceae bacterium]|nr:alpha-L-fucosidase [Balneolaceae bacterium]